LSRLFPPFQHRAEPVPLIRRENLPHVDQHHQLPLEELSPGPAEAPRGGLDGLAVELRAAGRRTVEMVAESIVAKVREDGYSPDDVLAYERQNLNRQEVLEALEELVRVPEEDGVEVTA